MPSSSTGSKQQEAIPNRRRDGRPLRRYRPKLSQEVKQHLSPQSVRAIREAFGYTQSDFAALFGIPLRALQLWEYGKRGVRGAPATLLKVIARNPRAVIAALKAASPDVSPPVVKGPKGQM